MMRRLDGTDAVLSAVRGTLESRPRPVLLAVSGGLDSMVLLDAVVRAVPERVAAVATFDHRSGAYARRAASLVERVASSRGCRVIAGRAEQPMRGEAAWREARWAFLQRAGADAGGDIVTAHTLDDQLETICIRVLRGSGARGLAALHAPSKVLRPLVTLRRTQLEAYARDERIEYLEDPTNRSAAFLRNRIRHDLLPAIARVQPGFADAMIELSLEAAALRLEVDDLATRLIATFGKGEITTDHQTLQDLRAGGLSILLPALAACAGIILDRRGTTRLSKFILEGRPGRRVQLSGGAEAVLSRGALTIRRMRAAQAPEEELPLDLGPVAGGWRFHRVARTTPDDAWAAALPAGSRLTVRRWRAGDRMRAMGTLAARRVKRFFSDAGIAGFDRIGWPVVLADGEIVWIPGVRRSDAATDRSGRPVVRYRCERNDV